MKAPATDRQIINNTSRASGDWFLEIFHTLLIQYTDSMVSKGFHINDGKLEKNGETNSTPGFSVGTRMPGSCIQRLLSGRISRTDEKNITFLFPIRESETSRGFPGIVIASAPGHRSDPLSIIL
jgi:hypothetical protein